MSRVSPRTREAIAEAGFGHGPKQVNQAIMSLIKAYSRSRTALAARDDALAAERKKVEKLRTGHICPQHLAIMCALLRVVYQSFDSGGESCRSLCAQCLEAVLFNLPHPEPETNAAYSECDQDPYAFVSKARVELSEEAKRLLAEIAETAPESEGAS